jgi:hypothetical protein
MEDKSYIISALKQNPTLYLDEIQDRIWDNREIDVSISTISRILREMAISNKKVAYEALQRNNTLRDIWIGENGGIPMEYIVCLDEAGIEGDDHQRLHGWESIGLSCIRRAIFCRGTRFSVLPALTVDGVVTMDIYKGTVNTEIFLTFIREKKVHYVDKISDSESIEYIYFDTISSLGGNWASRARRTWSQRFTESTTARPEIAANLPASTRIGQQNSRNRTLWPQWLHFTLQMYSRQLIDYLQYAISSKFPLRMSTVRKRLCLPNWDLLCNKRWLHKVPHVLADSIYIDYHVYESAYGRLGTLLLC